MVEVTNTHCFITYVMSDSRDQENLALRQFDKRQTDERQLAKIQVVNRQALGGSLQYNMFY